MEFIYANELKTMFSVFGHFYNLEIGDRTFKCRSVLEIVSKSIDDFKNSKPSALVVMMNPGSSKPLNRDYKPKKFSPDEVMSDFWEKEIVLTRPDNAQYQIMRLMLLKEWKHVRVLNLSDLRNGNSGEFSTDYNDSKIIDPSTPHSLINSGRLSELKKYCSESALVIAAWGSAEVLREAAVSFLTEITNVRGLPLEEPWYRYPSPYKKDQKLDWLKRMHEELKYIPSLQEIA